jgi:DNA-binding transcriptional ArsR family regulator
LRELRRSAKADSERSQATSASLDLIFAALSNPTRRAIIAKLSNGESSVTELAEPFEMSLPAISKHLDVLERARVISRVKMGRTHLCRIEPARLEKAAGWIKSYEAMWERQLDSLTGYLETSGEDG